MKAVLAEKRGPEIYTEFRLLINQMRLKGYRPADVARMLNVSRGAISQYMSGYTKPSNTVVEFLRRIDRETLPKDENKRPRELLDLIQKLSILHGLSPKAYQEIQNIIDTHYQSVMLAGKLDDQAKYGDFRKEAMKFVSDIKVHEPGREEKEKFKGIVMTNVPKAPRVRRKK